MILLLTIFIFIYVFSNVKTEFSDDFTECTIYAALQIFSIIGIILTILYNIPKLL